MRNEGLGSLKTIYQRSIPRVLLVEHAYTCANLTGLCERKLKRALEYYYKTLEILQDLETYLLIEDRLYLPDLLVGYYETEKNKCLIML